MTVGHIRFGEGHQFESGQAHQAHFYQNKKLVIKIRSKLYHKIFFIVLFLSILILAFFITKPFLPALLTGAILAYLSYPLYEGLLKYVKRKQIASFIVAIIIFLLLTVPFVLIIGIISNEAYSTYLTFSNERSSLNHQNLGANFMNVVCRNEQWLSCRATKFIIGVLPEDNLDYYIKVTIQKITVFIINNVSKFVASLPLIFLNLFVILFVVYYLLIDGNAVVRRIKNIIPLKESHQQHVFKKFHDVTFAVFYGNILIAIVQGILGGIGFFVLGVQSPILWGFVMILFALIPYFGTAIIWLPAALNLLFIGYLQNDSSSTVKGIILLIYGLLVISSIDNILKPKLIGSRAKVHPVWVLLGVLGGLSLFGFIGLILGPVMLALLMTFVDIYEEEKAELD